MSCSAVPSSLREAGYGLGATKFEVATRVVLPAAAVSGVVASFILALIAGDRRDDGRRLAAGSGPKISLDPLTSIETMTAYIVASTVSGEASDGSPIQRPVRRGHGAVRDHPGHEPVSARIVRRFREVYSVTAAAGAL